MPAWVSSDAVTRSRPVPGDDAGDAARIATAAVPPLQVLDPDRPGGFLYERVAAQPVSRSTPSFGHSSPSRTPSQLLGSI
jgi:hypothetical protein